MSDDVIHASVLAVETIRQRKYVPDTSLQGQSACERRQMSAGVTFFGAYSAELILMGTPGPVAPTCQACRVLLDAALENPREVAP